MGREKIYDFDNQKKKKADEKRWNRRYDDVSNKCHKAKENAQVPRYNKISY